ncbi:MAG: polysaccharide biosynthesis C-terminal domain-containing protein [Clostridia bacterium]|nr:polysaccharide biosynthesis C-terminal domain-containing protein [Clostridia bacterium]
MGKYKRLISNTAILGAGTFASKVLVLLLMPLYTAILSTSEFGTADLISQTANLLIPLASVGICDGIFRFALEESVDRRSVFSTGISILLCGSVGALGLIQLLRLFDVFSGYVMLVAGYVIAANLHSAFANYIRAQGRTGLFAVQGIINTVLTILLNVLFLIVFDLGSLGYVLSVVIADSVMVVILFFVAKLWREFSISSVTGKTARAMLRFSIPYIPTTMMWLITAASDRYIVSAYCGTAENGLYAAAYKLPTLLSLVSGVFIEAWHFSTVKDASDEERSDFFGSVYVNFMSIMVMGSSLLIVGAKVFTSILLDRSYFASWEFVPVLVIATLFSTLVSFLGSVYFLEKKSLMSMLTAMSGAIVNVILNFVMIPKHGAMGAAVATLISYLTVYVIRAVDTRNYLKFSLHTPRLIINGMVLAVQAVIMISAVRYWWAAELLLLGFLLVFNGRGIVRSLVGVLRSFLGNRKNSQKL